MPGRPILLGVVGRPHGVRGLVHVHRYATDPASLCRHGPLSDDQGRAWTLAWHADGVAELRDVAGRALSDRGAAEALTNTRLYIDRDQLPPPEVDEFYFADLIGLDAVGLEGAPIGRVTQVHEYGAGTSLEIERPGEAPLLLPFTRASVPQVNVAAGILVVAPPAETEWPHARAG